MEEDDDFDPSQEKTLFNIKSASIKDIRELAGAQLRSLRIMHSPDLHSVAVIWNAYPGNRAISNIGALEPLSELNLRNELPRTSSVADPEFAEQPNQGD